MGLVTSRLNFESLHVGGLRSQQDEVFFYYFSNYFLMGGERYEVNDPDYLFGDICDLNFLGRSKPNSIPYKRAQQNLLGNLKQNKSCNKVSSRVGRLSSPLSILRNSDQRQTSDLRKNDAQQTQNLNSKSSNSEPSQPLVMLINIRKETIRLVKSPSISDQLTDTTKHDVSSLVSACSNIEDDEDEFKDALNDGAEDSGSDKAQQHESLLPNGAVRITIETGDANNEGTSNPKAAVFDDKSNHNSLDISATDERVYNIEFSFDSEVDCTMRIFYFCTRESTSSGVNYKPLHATYKSKIYTYKKGLNQKFIQPQHTFQPYLFDEDLLIYKPLDTEGNFNSSSVFPIVIQCTALEGPTPRQSHSLIATIEKSQLDGSYSIKPLKQLIFSDGIQFILQDIYGIEHSIKRLTKKQKHPGAKRCDQTDNINGLKQKSNSLQSNLSDITSVSGVECSLSSRGLNRGSTSSNQHRSLGSENTSECVICISEERDTMLLPCRHLCLCISCAQSLRYQANSCPICRSPFRAALNIRRSAQLSDKEDLGRN